MRRFTWRVLEEKAELLDEDEAYNDAQDHAGENPQPKVKPPKRRFTSKYNLLSRLLLLFVDPLIWTGFRRPLNQSDLYAHPKEVASEKLLKIFNKHWKAEMDRKKYGKKPRLFIAVIKCLGWRISIHGILLFIEISLRVAISVLLGYLSSYFNGNTALEDLTTGDSPWIAVNSTVPSLGIRKAYGYALGIALMSLIGAFLDAHALLLADKLGMMSRILLTGAIYQKVLSLSQVTVGRVTIGRIVNLASNDVQRLDLVFTFIHFLWIAPIHLAVVTYLVYLEVGVYALVVPGFVFTLVPLQVLTSRFYFHLRLKSAVLTDKRIRIMNEIITGIRVIKMYAWEYAFKRVVKRLRKLESFIILKAGVIRISIRALSVISISTIMYIIFVPYTATGGELTPKKFIVILSQLILLRLTMFYFLTQTILSLVEGKVAAVRIQELLEMDELEFQKDILDDQDGFNSHVKEASIIVRNLSASWDNNNTKLVLSDIDFSMTQDNNLLAVVGRVGSGKSTLLQCLLNELKPMEGSIKVNGSVAYASQDPWIYSATLRENILFGKPYDRIWYKKVIEACALVKDIELLIDGDLTLVGERGVTLSGGQKARVNLARAVYHDADIYLLDDPLSAVDTAVGKHLFEKCICGLLKGRLVILVTHQVHFALMTSELLVLEEGRMVIHGSFSDLLSRGVDPQYLLKLISSEIRDGDDDYDISAYRDEEGSGTKLTQSSCTSSIQLDASDDVKLSEPSIDLSLKCSQGVVFSHPSEQDSFDQFQSNEEQALIENNEDEDEDEDEVHVLPEEEKEQGSISAKTYYLYFRAGGNIILLMMAMITGISGQIGITLVDWWLANWAACNVAPDNSSTCSMNTNERIYVLSGLTFFAIIINFVRTISFYFVCVNASRILHHRMFKSILRAPVLFFDTNPIGRVLNRFSKDVGLLDDQLPFVFTGFVLLNVRTTSIVIIALVANWVVIFPAIVLVVVLLLIRWYYLRTAREIKRLEAIARSPVYSHLSTTIQGLSTIRTFKKQDKGIEDFHKFQNSHSQGWYLYIVVIRWLALRIDSLCAFFITAVSLISVGLSSYISDRSLVGISLVYTISLTDTFQYVVRQSAEVENLMVSSERVMAYSRLESEASLETSPPHQKPPENWPSKGEVHLEDVRFRYASDLPLVLNNLSFSVRPSEKIGIVGRTGAGKSSLLSVLYRLAEPSGSITIDDVDTKSIGLHDLRKKMSIIPQDPVLFSGTMRYNLDPFEEYSDAELWKVLEQVQLKPEVEGLEGQLSGEVSEGGSNFSVGQRQLVCLARALLRKNKILILDEATANVDPRTDAIIQDTIRDIFSDCTVLTIAHRLNTIMDSDRILVMSSGQVIELNSPLILLQNKKSHFSMMVAKTGPEASGKLYEMAVEAERKRNKGSTDNHEVSNIYC